LGTDQQLGTLSISETIGYSVSFADKQVMKNRTVNSNQQG